jgi:uncharacterized protein (DUF1501 family)
MKPPELQKVLTEFTADRLALLLRHEAGARVVSHYDFNNTYQYVIAREETHVTWLQAALAELSAPVPSPAAALPVPDALKSKKVEPASYRPILEDDARGLGSFLTKWRGRVDEITHARHRTMLNVIIGESAEHMRLFEQAAGGFEDLLGKRTGGVARQGGVLSTRWME